jgi:hypothetical protein
MNAVEDITNNASTATNITFTTIDPDPPIVTFNPVNGATNVANGGNIVLTFNEPIRRTDNSDLTNTNVDALITLKLTNAAGANIAFDATINATDTEITINPTATLPDLAVIYVAIGSGAEDLSNNVLAPQSVSFTTSDVTPPVMTFTPLNGAVNVLITANIEIAFNEPVRNSGGGDIINANAAGLFIFKLTNAAGANVPFTASINAGKNLITIDPTSSLVPNQLYFLRYDVVEDLYGNLTTASNITFTTQPAPTITNFTPAAACVGGSVTITGNNFGTAPTVSVSGSDATVTASSNTSVTFTVPNAAAGSITVTNSTSGLSAISVTNLTINPVPSLFTVTGGGIFCTGTAGLKIGVSDSETGITYEIFRNGTPSGIINAGTGNALDFTTLVTQAGTYTVEGRNAGCSTTMMGSATVTVGNPPSGVGTAAGIASLCPGVTAKYTVTGIVNADSYVWSVPNGFEVVSQSGNVADIKAISGSGGVINVEGRNTCGSGGTASVNTGILPAPDVSITLPDDAFIDDPLTFAFTSSSSIESQTWSFGDENSSTDPTPQHIYTVSSDYAITLEVVDDKGCKNTDSEILHVNPEAQLSNYSIKNVVTANGDDKNKYLYVERIERFPDSEVVVLDRMGVEVFRKKNYVNDWDLRKGEEFLPAGSYVCVVLHDGKTYSRGVTVLKSR